MLGGVRLQIGAAATCALLLTAASGAAEQRRESEPRPFRPNTEEHPRRLLTFDVAVNEAFGDAADGLSGDRSWTTARVNSLFTGGGRNVTFTAGGGAEYRYHTSSGTLSDQGRHGTIGLEARGRATRFKISQHVRQLPFLQLVGLPSLLGAGASADTSADHALGAVPNTLYGTAVALHRGIGRNGSVVFDYGLSMTRTAGQNSQDVQRAGGLVTRRLSRHLDLRLGYHARWRRPGPDADIVPLLSHDIDAGVAFTRELSMSRGTSLVFTSGSSIVSADFGPQYILTGSAALNQTIGRTWNATLMFDRGLDYPDALPHAVIADQLSIGLGGFIGRRFNLRLRASGGMGSTGFEADGKYRTFGAEARAAVAIGRRWQWFAEPFYFHHEATGAALAAGLPAATSRIGVRTGLDVQLAFLDRRRR
jgi:hypothetical protein